MTKHTIFTRFVQASLLATLIVPWTASASFAQDAAQMAAITNFYKSRTEVLTANASNQSAFGAVLSAQATYIKAQGDYLKSQAEAFVAIQNGLKTQQETHGLRLDNSLKHADVFYKKRGAHEQYRTAHPRDRVSPGEKAAEAKAEAAPGTPARAASLQLTDNGKITWTHILMDDRFAENREEVESLFRTRTGGFGSEDCYRIKMVTDEMKETLRSIIREVPPGDYLVATRLLDGLASEARFAPERRDSRIATERRAKENRST
jgi:hypothetical protein